MVMIDLKPDMYGAVQEIYFTSNAPEKNDELMCFMDQYVAGVLKSSDEHTVLSPGTYNTITNGHISLLQKIIKKYGDIIDKIVIGIGVNPDKKNEDFTLKEREDMIRKSLLAYPEIASKIEIKSYSGFLYDYADEKGIPVIIRGIRSPEEYNAERELRAAGNTHNSKAITHYIPAEKEMAHISSSYTTKILTGGGSITDLVPPYVKQCLEARKLGQYRLGLTGVMNAGKSYVGKKLKDIGEKTGIPVYNIELDPIIHKIYDGRLTDSIYRQARKKIIETFGKDVTAENDTINRSVLRKKVSKNPEILHTLNAILHDPLMTYLRRHEIFDKKGMIIFNAALIAETDMNYLTNNYVILVTADEDSLRRRFDDEIKSEKITTEEFLSIQRNQYTEEEKRNKINEDIDKKKHGKIWTFDDSDDSKQSIDSFFHEIVRDIDQYGQLRFVGLWNRLEADGDAYDEYQNMLNAYLAGDRVYHSINHIVDGLDKLEDAIEYTEAKGMKVDADALTLAWYLHDVVKKKNSRVDEERSAKYAYDTCVKALREDIAEKVKKCVLVTKHDEKHQPMTIEEELSADVDLSIFGESSKIFNEYENDIRREFYFANDIEFIDARIQVLEKFQKRYKDGGHIYYTDFFREKYEEQARENLDRSIARLKEEQMKWSK